MAILFNNNYNNGNSSHSVMAYVADTGCYQTFHMLFTTLHGCKAAISSLLVDKVTRSSGFCFH